ncbi:hypothetical protein KIN20_023688 [Parelaphostrongylus tenuis]|uniref:Uncharacterized protein n=1 Tax=Parelaphostrongylus tenuis TaxID=148309 RepID=A0AAD5N7F0_PARTN|nr:hypothetical protein KIN20_023688 [Parelaphostrongylus tenuis]
MFSVVLLLPLLQAIELPLAPYNVKVFCRQGRRYSNDVQTAMQCPSSTTACGFFEFTSPDQKGVYECVDNGILETNDNDVDEDNLKLFAQLCGATPQCSYLNLNKLNTAFVKYMSNHHNIQLESLTSHTIRFCCSLFHHTLQKLVTSGKDKLPNIPAPPVHCESEVCDEDAVGCLLHSLTGSKESDEYYDDDDDDDDNGDSYTYGKWRSARQKRYRRQQQEHRAGDDERIDAVQLFFDFEEDEHGPSLQLVTRNPSSPQSSSSAPRLVEVSKPTMTLRKPSWDDRSEAGAITSRNHVHNDDDEESDDTEELHCVYRHLNDEFYRYCLLVHQAKDGDRCYHHEGHTICCCFVPPDKETCDPTEIDLVRPTAMTRFPPVRVTPRPNVMKINSAATRSSTTTTAVTSTSTITTASTTTTAIISATTPHKDTSTPTYMFIIKPRNTSLPRRRFVASRKRRCRITYPRKKTNGSNTKPVIICDSARSIVGYLFLSMLLLRCV